MNSDLKNSVKIIKDMQLKNGGILATNLDGAYPYVYVRDGVIMTLALNRTGNLKDSEDFYYFMEKNLKLDHYKEIFHRYNKMGLPCATRKAQKDNLGLLIHGIYDLYTFNKNENFLKNMWILIKECVKIIKKSLRNGILTTETSIHEFSQLEKGHEIWSNCACCRGMYSAAEIAKILNYKKEYIEWKKLAEEFNKNIQKRFYNKKTGLFMKNLKYPNALDSSQIAPFYFELVNSKPILKKTLQVLQKNLWNEDVGGFKRFKKFEICEDWHWYTGGSGGWVIFTAIMQRMYKRISDKKNYNLCRNWIQKTHDRTKGLLPEHVATKKEYDLWKMQETEFNDRIVYAIKKSEDLNKYFLKKYKEDIVYWAVPLGWSHAEYILANL